jgi:hypothetical protein
MHATRNHRPSPLILSALMARQTRGWTGAAGGAMALSQTKQDDKRRRNGIVSEGDGGDALIW